MLHICCALLCTFLYDFFTFLWYFLKKKILLQIFLFLLEKLISYILQQVIAKGVRVLASCSLKGVASVVSLLQDFGFFAFRIFGESQVRSI